MVIDVSANVGNHSLFLASKGIKVIAFEANPKLCEIIKENIKNK
ncbi:TPA: FkbM family methyltransferase [Campylobacter jejuni]|nr:FkbM family methyltransferase [Campylobacter jejuni]HDZ5086683.1 FkbM family methyltransferase [Campylobacter jejuni]HDZ5090112.1 FkbM family methyltransferase [Campylobacter jejuni]HDZ5100110.1 FkbM family methyltransferase [Campylobacter jejuni]HDZ5105357.1 FkbM family methyltransferase [Campylobacter jejuni]